MTSTQWIEYHNGTKRKSYNTLPTSNITAEAVSVGGFTISQTDNVGVTTTAGRTLTVTDAQGNTSCYRYDVRGYLQITCCDLNRSNHPALWFITWEPTQPIATRPLAIQKDGTWYPAPARLASQDSRSQVCSRLGVWLLKSHPAYGWDLTKNICELYGSNGYIRTAYTPYGEVTESTNSVYQPIQWSSEYNDTELSLVYYNYRHYNPMNGRWLGRYGIEYNNLYIYINNIAIYSCDYIGLLSISDSANISEVDRSKLGKEIARMIPVTIPEIVRIRIGCCMLYDVPDTELKFNIELANKDRDYISDLVALRVERNNPFINLDYAKKWFENMS